MIGADFAEVLAAAQQGDAAAFERLYRDTAPLILGYLRGRRAIDPEDQASEVFVAMVRSIGTFRGDERQFRSWLLTIAHRRSVDALRRHGRRPEDLQDIGQLSGDVAVVESGEAIALRKVELDSVLDRIDDLTEDQRAVLLLRTLGELSIEEVAGILGKPVTAVKALQRRAVASLRRSISQAEQ